MGEFMKYLNCDIMMNEELYLAIYDVKLWVVYKLLGKK